MSKKILAFGASSSRKSINKQLAAWAAGQIEHADVTVLDLNDFEMPIFSIDRENENGVPDLARKFKEHIRQSDGIIISFAEHNGCYTAAFKNIMDWVSRVEKSMWLDKPMFLMASSPGGRGGATVLDIAVSKFKFMNGNVAASFSLPSFYQKFSAEDGITDEELSKVFQEELEQFEKSLS